MVLSSGGEGLRSSPYRTVLRAPTENTRTSISGTSGPPHALPSTTQLILGHLEPFWPKHLCRQPNSPLTPRPGQLYVLRPARVRELQDEDCSNNAEGSHAHTHHARLGACPASRLQSARARVACAPLVSSVPVAVL